MKNLKHHLEVALAVKRTSCKKLAQLWDVTDTHIWNVARGTTTSIHIRPKIVDYIILAQEQSPLLEDITELAA
ncbi:MAG: hypothetical protein ABJ387_01585 [Balneola sp.]